MIPTLDDVAETLLGLEVITQGENLKGVPPVLPMDRFVDLYADATNGVDGAVYSVAHMDVHHGRAPLEIEAASYVAGHFGHNVRRGVTGSSLGFDQGGRAQSVENMLNLSRRYTHDQWMQIDPDQKWTVVDGTALFGSYARGIGTQVSLQRRLSRFTRMKDLSIYDLIKMIDEHSMTPEQIAEQIGEPVEVVNQQLKAYRNAATQIADKLHNRHYRPSESSQMGWEMVNNVARSMLRAKGSGYWWAMSLLEEGLKNLTLNSTLEDQLTGEFFVRMFDYIKAMTSTYTKRELADTIWMEQDIVDDPTLRYTGEFGARQSRNYRTSMKSRIGRFVRGFMGEEYTRRLDHEATYKSRTQRGFDRTLRAANTLSSVGLGMMSRITLTHAAVGIKSQMRRIHGKLDKLSAMGVVDADGVRPIDALTPELLERARLGSLTKDDLGILRKLGFPNESERQLVLDLADAGLLNGDDFGRLKEVLDAVMADADTEALPTLGSILTAADARGYDYRQSALKLQRYMRIVMQRVIPEDTAATGFTSQDMSDPRLLLQMALLGFTRNMAGTFLSQARRGTGSSQFALVMASTGGAVMTGAMMEYMRDPDRFKENWTADPLGTLTDSMLFNPIFGFAGPMLQLANNVARYTVNQSPLANELYGGTQTKFPYVPDLIPSSGARALTSYPENLMKFFTGDWMSATKLIPGMNNPLFLFGLDLAGVERGKLSGGRGGTSRRSGAGTPMESFRSPTQTNFDPSRFGITPQADTRTASTAGMQVEMPKAPPSPDVEAGALEKLLKNEGPDEAPDSLI